MNYIVKTILLLLICSNLGAESNQSRVLELENIINGDVNHFLEKFAPNSKNVVKVSVKPLRRAVTNNSQDLPFMEYEQDLVLDEWDDPQVSIYSLYNRIAEAKVSIYIEKSISIPDRSKFKEAILLDANLRPGRDEVTIDFISSPVLEKEFQISEHLDTILIFTVGGGILLIGLLSLMIINKKILPATNAQKTNDNLSSLSITPKPSNLGTQVSQLSGGLQGDLQIQDPTKINEIVDHKIKQILESEMFPTLNDIKTLEELLTVDFSSFSYLIYEFPQSMQKKIYQRGRQELWFKGFSEVGVPSRNVVSYLDKMLRERVVHESLDLEEILIQCWRMGEHLVPFIKTLDKNLAQFILFHLPKDIAIPASKECFPGAWGGVLAESAPAYSVSNEELSSMLERSYKMSPLYDFESLQAFKNRKDLLRYLDKVEPHEEKEIYTVLGSDHNLKNIRPPFFHFFELEKDKRALIYKKYSLEDWALACFNIDRQEKEKLTELMTEKERYLFGRHLSTLDQGPGLTLNRSEIRHHISQLVNELEEVINFSEATQKDIEQDDVA